MCKNRGPIPFNKTKLEYKWGDFSFCTINITYIINKHTLTKTSKLVYEKNLGRIFFFRKFTIIHVFVSISSKKVIDLCLLMFGSTRNKSRINIIMITLFGTPTKWSPTANCWSVILCQEEYGVECGVSGIYLSAENLKCDLSVVETRVHT